MNGKPDRLTVRKTERETDGLTRETERYIDSQTVRQTQTDRQTQKYRQTVRHRD